jgi:hypothetical protein
LLLELSEDTDVIRQPKSISPFKRLEGFSTGRYLKSGHHIELLPEFETLSNQLFRAEISDCGTGGLPD